MMTLIRRAIAYLVNPDLERSRAIEPPIAGELHFRDGPIIQVPAYCAIAAINALIAPRERRREYRGVWE